MILIKMNTLNQMFEHSSDKVHLSFNGSCRSCGHAVTIEIHHHSAGYGLLGGVIYEQGLNQLIAKCEECYHNNYDLEDIKE